MGYDGLISIMEDARRLICLPANDFSWSPWEGEAKAIEEIDGILEGLRAGELPDSMEVLFLPTGPLQEVSVSSGWGNEFLNLASRFDRELRRARRSAEKKVDPGSRPG